VHAIFHEKTGFQFAGLSPWRNQIYVSRDWQLLGANGNPLST
jgi:hypothetical protein